MTSSPGSKRADRADPRQLQQPWHRRADEHGEVGLEELDALCGGAQGADGYAILREAVGGAAAGRSG
jgi:hypothetical protein